MTFIPGTQIEIVRENARLGLGRCALFDFDGTISLIREGWQGVMVPMMVGILRRTPGAESEEAIERMVREFVGRLTGKQTIYQMIRLAEEVAKRGKQPLDPVAYKRIYHDRLLEKIGGRLDSLKDGHVSPDDMMVPGSRAMLSALKDRGIACYLASGTDQAFVLQEAELLGVAGFFDGIYGAFDDYKRHEKSVVLDQIMRQRRVSGPELISFGDGFVEMEDSRQVGAISVGVASNEAERSGVDNWKRRRLVEAGADMIIPDYRDHRILVEWLLAQRKELH